MFSVFDTVVAWLTGRFWVAPELSAVHLGRQRRLLWLASLLMLFMGLGWALFFGWQRQWFIVALDLLMVLCAVAVLVLMGRGRIQLAATLMTGCLWSVLCLICLLFDVPSAQAPRTTHLFLLPLAVSSMVAFRAERLFLRRGMPLLCLLAFVLLSATAGTVVPGYGLPDSIRLGGGWVNTLGAVLMLAVGLHIMQTESVQRSGQELALRQAIRQQQFVLHLQAQVDASGRIIGAEALLRWQHPQRGLVMPGEFIETAEQSGLILPIGYWVLQSACQQLDAWRTDPVLSGLNLAVNTSALQFRQPGLVEQVVQLVERYAIAPGRLELELTESMLVHDLPDIVGKMNALRQCGVTFSLDDFGTGYSSLSYLKRLPLRQLKIDQSFVRDLQTDANDAAIVRTVIHLGQSLGLSVIAEGVESQGQHQFLLQHGCQFFQGYLFSRPLPIAAFENLVQQQQSLGQALAAPASASATSMPSIAADKMPPA